MPRKALKRENMYMQPSVVDEEPFSSGDTIRIDPEVVTVDESPDEGYHTNQECKINVGVASDVSSLNVDDGLHVLGRGVKELVQKVQALRHLGVEDLVLPLPKIVVVGDQSTGKSSLIEGMSEIKVPRSAGTCTRCPLEINLAENLDPQSQWSCEVYLHKKYVYQGTLSKSNVFRKNPVKSEGATRSRPLGPWMEQDSEDLPFASLSDKGEVVDALERAQLATLNPSSSYEKYKPGNTILHRGYQVKFSPNVIRLDISGPGLPNLSFYDLPGVINVTDVTEEAYLVDLVRNLVKDYIKAENCINLLALTMTHDAANSSAFGLIKELKAEARTMGCLTKPDRREPGEALDQWVQILHGQQYQLGFGYHVIKNNPNPRVDHATARREEAAFFSENEPWTTELSAYSNRFGTLQLQSALSRHLTEQIRTSLPGIIDKVQQKAEFIDARVRELPEPLSDNLPAIVYGELFKFEAEIEKHIEGGSDNNVFQKEWYNRSVEFRKVLADSRPILKMHTQRTSNQTSQGTPRSETAETPTPTAIRNAEVMTIESDSDPDDPSPTTQVNGRKRRMPSTQSTPRKFPRTVNQCPRANGVTSKCFDLYTVRNFIQDAYIGLPDVTDPKAVERMIKLSMEHWDEPLERFLTRTRELCETMVFDQVTKVFGSHQQTQYYDQIIDVCKSFFDGALIQQRQVAKDILSWEQSKPKTLNLEAMKMASDKALMLLQARRREYRAQQLINEQEAKSGKPTTGPARLEKMSKVTDVQLPPELYGEEIKAMSTVKGYYECAYNRFVDTLCASIYCGLFSKCCKEIVSLMKSKFGVTEAGAHERLALLLAANPEQERRRTQLKREMEMINKAQQHLEGLSEQME